MLDKMTDNESNAKISTLNKNENFDSNFKIKNNNIINSNINFTEEFNQNKNKKSNGNLSSKLISKDDNKPL